MPRAKDCCDEIDILRHNLQLGAYLRDLLIKLLTVRREIFI